MIPNAKMLKMRAFNGDPAVKQKYLDRVRAHQAADEIVKGQYWQNGKGCAVGCTLESGNSDNIHAKYEKELGIPEAIAHLEDYLFEQMPNEDAMLFPARFLEAIEPGADLSLVPTKLIIYILDDLQDIKEVRENAPVSDSIKGVRALWARVAAGESVPSAAWSAAWSAAESAARSAAESAARSAARSAAWSAAWSAAESAARSAAESAAESAARSAAESAAWSAAESAAWSAAESAARSAARSAAWSAAWSAAESAARSAAESAARSAAESAARSAARSAAESAARSAAWSAAWSAAESAAGKKYGNALIELLKQAPVIK